MHLQVHLHVHVSLEYIICEFKMHYTLYLIFNSIKYQFNMMNSLSRRKSKTEFKIIPDDFTFIW